MLHFVTLWKNTKNTEKDRRTPRKIGECRKNTKESNRWLCNPQKSRRPSRKVGETPKEIGETPTYLGQPKLTGWDRDYSPGAGKCDVTYRLGAAGVLDHGVIRATDRTDPFYWSRNSEEQFEAVVVGYDLVDLNLVWLVNELVGYFRCHNRILLVL